MATQGYRPFPYKGFGGGLNLRDGPDVVEEDQAIDGLNFMLTTRGSVAERSGYAKLTSAEGTNRYDSLAAFYKVDDTKHIIAGAGNRLEALTAAGAIIDSTNSPTANPHFFTRFGGPTAEHMFIANGADALRRWTGAAFDTPAYSGTTPRGKFLGLSVTDNRLINARFSGSSPGNNPSTVRFSAEGDPLTWGADHYQDFAPGDGEEIMGIASWRDLTFVFKESRFWVIYGFQPDDDGEPDMLFRPVDAGVGLVSSRSIAIAEQGIYFLSRTGVYFTNGLAPARVSDIVEPIFKGDASVYYTGGTLNDGSIEETTMVYHDERLWLSFPSGASAVNDKNLIFDPHEKWWSLANIPAAAMINFRPGTSEELVFAYASGTKHLGRYVDGQYTADDMSAVGAGGTAIAAHWQGGWFNYATPLVKTIREAKISGTGLVTVEYFRDYRQVGQITQIVELSPPTGLYDDGLLYDTPGLRYGPSGVVTAKPLRKSIRGESFSIRLSNPTIHRSFKVHRLTTHIREARVPSVVKVN
jgi:hypothetical protein